MSYENQDLDYPLYDKSELITKRSASSAGFEDDDEEKKTGRRKIKIEYIEDKSRRHITFSKRKAGIMKKAYELSTLTGTQILLLVASETGHVYTFATPKLQPLITKPEGKNMIQQCLNQVDNPLSRSQTPMPVFPSSSYAPTPTASPLPQRPVSAMSMPVSSPQLSRNTFPEEDYGNRFGYLNQASSQGYNLYPQGTYQMSQQSHFSHLVDPVGTSHNSLLRSASPHVVLPSEPSNL